ncbi:PD-(D/E)XK nuclease family protein [Novosphingobium sp. JCM 18896]|uniref:PD-(D/E)XK nuclease family protein n=1 Tax=Novosphingobium sp. JCM 18896 TaxID=2989731 RepID=UPI002221B632|nr:PD-(D/E)XK nuclease family protein [Novosphingobium sp. JCM 18896]MCW1428568.1 PD-(D/E)XK nuclease family protein [Novosphingobium sp. JCM 18896]
MPEGPRIYSIAAHRGFADALVAGLIPRYSDGELGLARLTLLLPSQRAVRTVTEAFIRLSGAGMLLPRMAAVGDLDLDETLGALLDPLGAGAEVPRAVDPTYRWLRLAHYLRAVEGDQAGQGAALLRRAFELGRTMDRLLVEGIAPIDLLSEEVVGIVGDLARHWQDSTRSFLMVQAHWNAELAEREMVDAPTRRNALFDHAARRWCENPPENPIVAAGVTSASPALARLLRVVSELPKGAVVLPDLDLALDEDVWDALGSAGKAPELDGSPFGRNDAATHPQYHLKLLLNRMGVAREEVQPWHRAGLSASPPERSLAISNLFLPPSASARWVDLPADQRRLSGVRLMETAHPGEEAQAIAVLIREALEQPERRVALITPDRGLAGRVVAQLDRWGIEADDTAGQPLAQTPAGRLLLLLAELVAEQAAPVPLLALLTHPLVAAEGDRAAWLEAARHLDLALRGPRQAAGLAPIAAAAAKGRVAEWWSGVEAMLSPLFLPIDEAPLAGLLEALAEVAEALCGTALWGKPDGRALSSFVEDLREAARGAGTMLDPRELHAVLRDAMDRQAVRPPWGGHPRVSVYGLIEARMSRADLVICGGLTEGVWPASPSPDALLPPAVLRALGVPGADFRIGLSAHDLAAALGAPEVVLSWAQRDEGAPVIPSRFVLRVRAMLGDLLGMHEEKRAVELARAIDDAAPAPRYPQPQPMPSAEQRKVDIAVTGLDRLRGDPYQFYASSILRLSSLDPLDAEPSAAWKGTAVHAILERWHKEGGDLLAIADEELDEMSAHPLMRTLWRPRLVAALGWIGEEIARLQAEGRTVLASERKGDMLVKGVRVHGRADRIDKLPDGRLAVVDYKTGQPPSRSMVQEGFALQLGLIGMIAEQGGFEGVSGAAGRFEYWSLSRDLKQRGEIAFGYREEPILEGSRRTGIPREEFISETTRYLVEAIDKWILGSEPFTARLNPDIGGYNDYDQLMRLDEWLGQLGGEGDDAE